ncbi:hypothetical protein PM082_015687 [Marasmius tenuissimus]|nr:hypothetical protein PM082_015687 [Marasmius tenuissimus]
MPFHPRSDHFSTQLAYNSSTAVMAYSTRSASSSILVLPDTLDLIQCILQLRNGEPCSKAERMKMFRQFTEVVLPSVPTKLVHSSGQGSGKLSRFDLFRVSVGVLEQTKRWIEDESKHLRVHQTQRICRG